MMNIDGFKSLRGDRTESTGKERGGGVCAYVNEKWCHQNNATVIGRGPVGPTMHPPPQDKFSWVPNCSLGSTEQEEFLFP